MEFIDIWRIVQVVLGIGLVIFVHEAGHFLAARWCKVRVHVFSLGFGPTLFGWKRGHTTYKVCGIPLGGYVRMAGDETLGSGGEAEPWELGSKSVGQRFLIFSGGVLANVLFGMVVFPILFIAGIPSYEPLIGSVERGSPAWEAGLEAGTKVFSVNGVTVYDGVQVPAEVAYNGNNPVELEVQGPDESEPRLVELRPIFNDRAGFYTIGDLGYPTTSDPAIVVRKDSLAELAGLRSGDHFLRLEGMPSTLDAARQLTRAQDRREPIRVVYERDGAELSAEIEPKVLHGEGRTLLGVGPVVNRIATLRSSESAAATGLLLEDVILLVEGRPVRSPSQLLEALLAAEGPVEWVVRRDGADLQLTSPPLTAEQAGALWNDLFLDHDESYTGIVVVEDSAASAAGFLDGDVITHVDGMEVTEFEEIRKAAKKAGKEERPMRVGLRREQLGDASPAYLEIEATPGPTSLVDYGFSFGVARYTFRVSGAWEAISLGTRSCWNMLRDVWRTIRGILRRDVSEKSVGGIITIGVFAHQTASIGWVKFFWFLCLLSMNLAFLNVLPIPLLDGGHLFFLLIEGIKGSPVNERILGYSQLVGLVLIVSLFVFVIYNDLNTHVFGN